MTNGKTDAIEEIESLDASASFLIKYLPNHHIRKQYITAFVHTTEMLRENIQTFESMT